MLSVTVQGEKVQVSEVEKITCFDPLLYGKDYGAKAVTFLLKYTYLVKLLFRGFNSVSFHRNCSS